jgi:hypothetical protein
VGGTGGRGEDAAWEAKAEAAMKERRMRAHLFEQLLRSLRTALDKAYQR